MALSAGDDVLVVLISLGALSIIFVVGYFIVRRAYRRSQEKQSVLMSTREMELDFDTNDVEMGVSRLNKGHARSWSNESGTPLINADPQQWTPSPSKTSFDSDIHSVTTYAFSTKDRSLSPDTTPTATNFSVDIPYRRSQAPSPAPVIPSIRVPTPPPKDEVPPRPEAPSADHHLGSLVARPSFLTKPRPAPRPGNPRSRSRGAADMRSALLTRIASGRRARSADRSAEDEEDSPSSLYSQASAMPYDAGYQQFDNEAPPPVPAIPAQFQKILPIPPPPALASSGTHQSPIDEPLEESLAFPLPSTPSPADENRQSLPPQTPGTKWFQGLWEHSPSSTSPSPSHSPSDRPAETPADNAVISVRSTEVYRNVPQYTVNETLPVSKGETGTVGYQLPVHWRHSGTQESISMPTPSTAEPPMSSTMPTSNSAMGLAY